MNWVLVKLPGSRCAAEELHPGGDEKTYVCYWKATFSLTPGQPRALDLPHIVKNRAFARDFTWKVAF